MENCAATVRALPTCSRKTPSQSADECKAHRNSKTGGSSVIPRRKAYIFVERRRNDDGEKISERGANYEGKIKETGTTSGRFQGKPLSAHCFGVALAAPWFWPLRAASRRKALALLGFDRHHSSKSGVFPRIEPVARP
jgi:hypothetical protein